MNETEVSKMGDFQDALNVDVVSLEEYLRIFKEEKDSIKSVEIIPPVLGERDFGKIRIIRNYPVFKIPRRRPRSL